MFSDPQLCKETCTTCTTSASLRLVLSNICWIRDGRFLIQIRFRNTVFKKNGNNFIDMQLFYLTFFQNICQVLSTETMVNCGDYLRTKWVWESLCPYEVTI